MLIGGYCLAGTVFLALSLYGFDYYTLSAAQRPLSPKYDLLRPSGAIGLKLGFWGEAGLFAVLTIAATATSRRLVKQVDDFEFEQALVSLEQIAK